VSATPHVPHWRVLLWPHLRRLLSIQPLWALVFATFFKALEVANPLPGAPPLSFVHYLAANLMGAAATLAVAAPLWYALARHHWHRSEAARQRHERDGVYALLPRPLMAALVLTVYLLSAPLSYGLWTLYLNATGTWPGYQANQASLLIGMVFHGFSMLVIFLVDVIRVKAMVLQLRAERTQRLHAQAQLQRLQAQLHPHMLFNTLANLHALIDTQPAAAQDMLAHLIDYLRATLNASQASEVTLQQEMAQARDYLALMQVRMGARLQVDMDVDPALHAERLPPMLVQPLIENAIKHGLDPLPQGGTLRVRAHRDEAMLVIEVRDSGSDWGPSDTPTPDAAHASPGFGLHCIAERLATAYGTAASLRLSRNGDHTLATLRLPLQAAAPLHPA